jgi:hypothetical protein
MRYRTRNQFARDAVDRAFTAFQSRHPDYAASLFDEHFLHVSVAPLITAPGDLAALSADQIAEAWADQYRGRARGREKLIAGAAAVAADFIELLTVAVAAPPRPAAQIGDQFAGLA